MAPSFRGMAGDEAGSKMRGYYSLNEDFRAKNYLVAEALSISLYERAANTRYVRTTCPRCPAPPFIQAQANRRHASGAARRFELFTDLALMFLVVSLNGLANLVAIRLTLELA